jgi:hypothetical protein
MLRVESLERRDTPTLYTPPGYVFGAIPGFSGPVEDTYGDIDGNGTVDHAIVAGAGGSCRVYVVSGGEIGKRLPDPRDAGYRGAEVLFDGVVLDPSFRGGGHVVASLGAPGAPATLYVTPGEGGGPVVAAMQFDPATGGMAVVNRVVPYGDADYRGGLRVAVDVGRDWVLFLPESPGYAPRLVGVNAAGNKVIDIFVGDPGDRSGTTQFLPAGVGVQLDPSNPESYGLGVWDGIEVNHRRPNTRLYGYDGTEYPDIAASYPGSVFPE